jgi:hypothetical protein
LAGSREASLALSQIAPQPTSPFRSISRDYLREGVE